MRNLKNLVTKATEKTISKSLKEARDLARVAKKENFENKNDIALAADYVAEIELTTGTKNLLKAAEAYKEVFLNVGKSHILLMEKAKLLTQQSKDYTNQVGEAMARIDKVLVKDFESKLFMLERFVNALNEMDDLNKRGLLKNVGDLFNREKA